MDEMRFGRSLVREACFIFGAAVSTLVLVAGCFGRSGLDEQDMFGPETGGEGGAGASAGTTASGGKHASGGTTSVGGKPSTGGFSAAGGFIGKGGFIGAGGVTGAGGFIGKGGVISAGGVTASGGRGTGGRGTGGTGGTGGAPACSPDTCAGCCTSGGICVPGTGANACGTKGARCTDCGSSGFGCDKGICQGMAPPCAMSCAGCCDSLGRCRLGSEIDACGIGGGACNVCSASNAACTMGKCGGPLQVCDATTCGGCCDTNGICRPGTTNAACGTAGARCENCTSEGKSCSEPGSYCAFIPSCSPTTCPTGCCDQNGVCQDGRTDAACGATGQTCSNCTNLGEACAPSGFCYKGAHCGPDTCAGCCSPDGTCRPGTAAQNCGAFGAVCENCMSQGQTCQAGACGVRGATCPAPYAGCNPGAATAPPFNGTSCKATDVALAHMACTGITDPATCLPALSKLLASNPGCYDCLQQFLYDGAVAKCLAPFLSPTCNHELTCYSGCLTTTCGACSDANRASCQGTVSASGGDCFSSLSGQYCAAAAFSGPAAFCDLGRVNDVGLWLAGVGAYYCSR
jgi:hypothetical protein